MRSRGSHVVPMFTTTSWPAGTECFAKTNIPPLPHVRMTVSCHMWIVQTSSFRPNKPATPNCAVLTCTRTYGTMCTTPGTGTPVVTTAASMASPCQTCTRCPTWWILQQRHSGSWVFSKIDLRKDYPLNTADISKTSPFYLYTYQERKTLNL